MQNGDQAIIVTYHLPQLTYGIYGAGYLEQRPDYEPNPTLYPGEGGGVVYQVEQLPLVLNCSSGEGTATAVANEIMKTDDVYGPTLFNWTTAEYGALVYQRTDGAFGVLNDSVYSIGQVGMSSIPLTGAERIVGLIHNHPDAIGNNDVDLIQRYPSPGDWAALEFLQSQNRALYPQYDLNLWILDRWGVTRKFNLSEKASLESLDDPARIAGNLLNGRENTTPCQPQP